MATASHTFTLMPSTMTRLCSLIRLITLLRFFCLSCTAFHVQRTTSSRHRQVLPSSPDDEFSTSVDFSMDPTSSKAKEIMNHLSLSGEQHQQLAKLSVLIVDWNERVNLISRRDCSKEVVFGRHIVPSLAPLGLESQLIPRDQEYRVVDVVRSGNSLCL